MLHPFGMTPVPGSWYHDIFDDARTRELISWYLCCRCRLWGLSYRDNSITNWEVRVGVVNTLRPRRNRCHFADDIFKCIFMNENVLILIKISLKFTPKGPINNIPALVQIMAWCRPGDKPLSEPMMTISLTHICVTQPWWVNSLRPGDA